MARVGGVDLEPYHNKPNPKVGVRQRDTTPKEFEVVGLNIDGK